MIEFLPWYEPAGQMMRCSVCACLVVSADVETHLRWHEEVSSAVDMPSQTG